MHFIFKKYGFVVEITQVEKEPTKVRFHHFRKRRSVYGARRPNNIYRTRKICMRRVFSALEQFGCPLLVTLTFRGDASDASFANDSLRSFQVRLRTQYPNAQSLFVPELSPRGRIHFHGLLFNVPLSLGDTVKDRRTIPDGDERKTRILAKLWGEGFVDAKKTDGSDRLANYISKYITKGGGQILFNAMRILRISHGFPKEEIIRGQLAETFAEIYIQKGTTVAQWEVYNPFLGKIIKRIYHSKK